MIIDHRTYTLRPGTIATYVKLYESQGYPIQSRHLGKPLGWFTSMDIGQLNQIVHLWAYEDLAERAKKRAAMQADPEWQAFVKEASTMIMTMENKILTPGPVAQGR
jgi:NIPSNAP